MTRLGCNKAQEMNEIRKEGCLWRSPHRSKNHDETSMARMTTYTARGTGMIVRANEANVINPISRQTYNPSSCIRIPRIRVGFSKDF